MVIVEEKQSLNTKAHMDMGTWHALERFYGVDSRVSRSTCPLRLNPSLAPRMPRPLSENLQKHPKPGNRLSPEPTNSKT